MKLSTFSLLLAGMVAGGAGVFGWNQYHLTQAATVSESAPAARKILYYRNPMGQPDRSLVPKKDSMGMDYIPVYADEQPEEKGAITIDASKRQNLGVVSVAATQAQLTREIKAVGMFAVDERRQYTVTAKLDGWVEKLYVNATGDQVKTGQPLFELYSPDLVVAQQEYRIAQQMPQAENSRQNFGQAALTRLRYWDIPNTAIQRLASGGEVKRTLPLTAPVNGVVLTKNITQGMKFSAGTALYEIADLSHLWLLVEVFEQDLAAVKIGQTVQIHVNAYPSKSFQGKVSFIYPTLNSETRTVQVRIELENPNQLLKPGMYAQAQVQSDEGSLMQTVVPESALIDSGKRQVVLIDKGDGKFAPRVVSVTGRGALENGERQIAVTNVQPGEKVVTQANFLIDSESNLQAAFSAMGG